MRNQKGLSSVEALSILVIIIIIGSVGCSRQEVGKKPGNSAETSESMTKHGQQQSAQPERTDETAEHLPQQSGRSEKTDETADWITYVSPKGGFSLRHPKSWAVGPKNPRSCADPGRTFAAGASADFVADCGTEYFGQVYVVSENGNQLSRYKLKNMGYPYQNITRQKVTVDDIEGAREAGTAMGQMDDEKFATPGLPDGTKVAIYSFYAHGRTYVAEYTQQIDEPDILRDFELLVTKTLRFSN
jgi:hypothetical protein